jgi:glycine cleavage system aminomethyltransferase T
VDLDRKEDFIGKAALLKEKENGPRFKTIGLSFDLNADQECDVEDGMKIYTIVDGKVQQAGIFPSVAWSSELNCWLGIASIKSDFSSDNLKYYVQFGEEQITCRPIKLPFVKFDRYREIPATL